MTVGSWIYLSDMYYNARLAATDSFVIDDGETENCECEERAVLETTHGSH